MPRIHAGRTPAARRPGTRPRFTMSCFVHRRAQRPERLDACGALVPDAGPGRAGAGPARPRPQLGPDATSARWRHPVGPAAIGRARADRAVGHSMGSLIALEVAVTSGGPDKAPQDPQISDLVMVGTAFPMRGAGAAAAGGRSPAPGDRADRPLYLMQGPSDGRAERQAASQSRMQRCWPAAMHGAAARSRRTFAGAGSGRL